MSAEPPFYESRYIRANHPDRPRALWLRETRLLPTTGSASADVWVMVFDPDGAGNRALRQSYPTGTAHFADWTVRIADTTLDDHNAQGDIGAARWDLSITPSGTGPVRVLTERAYRARIPTAKTTVRDPLARFDGLIALDGTTVDVDGWTGSINHNWGTRHTPAYAYGQICGFDDAPESTLELVTARAALGPMLLPDVTLFVFRHEGTEFAVRSVRDSLKTHGRYQPFVWRFGGRVGEKMIEGEMVAEPSDVLGLTYTDTDGTTKYCYNSALATCRIQVAGKAFTRAELTATRRAMFEILTDTPHPGIPLAV
ncbi:hypothetical protein [Mycolicibacterium phlei]